MKSQGITSANGIHRRITKNERPSYLKFRKCFRGKISNYDLAYSEWIFGHSLTTENKIDILEDRSSLDEPNAGADLCVSLMCQEAT